MATLPTLSVNHGRPIRRPALVARMATPSANQRYSVERCPGTSSPPDPARQDITQIAWAAVHILSNFCSSLSSCPCRALHQPTRRFMLAATLMQGANLPVMPDVQTACADGGNEEPLVPLMSVRPFGGNASLPMQIGRIMDVGLLTPRIQILGSPQKIQCYINRLPMCYCCRRASCRGPMLPRESPAEAKLSVGPATLPLHTVLLLTRQVGGAQLESEEGMGSHHIPE